MNSRRWGAWKVGHVRAIWPLMLPMTLQFIIAMIAAAINDRLQAVIGAKALGAC
jgi:hypothetical protein